MDLAMKKRKTRYELENSQQQIRLLSAQKTELLERVIQLTSQQAPLQTLQMQSPDLPPPPPPDYDDHDDMGAEASDGMSAPMMKKVLWRVIRVQAVRRQQFSLVLKYGRVALKDRNFDKIIL